MPKSADKTAKPAKTASKSAAKPKKAAAATEDMDLDDEAFELDLGGDDEDMGDDYEAADFGGDDDGEDDIVEIDPNILERIASALESIAKVLNDREAKFASRGPKPSFGGGDRGGARGGFGRDRDDGDERPRSGGFSKPGYGDKAFRSGPGVGFGGDRGGSRGGKSFGDKPSFGGGARGGKPGFGGKPSFGGAGKGAPKGRGKY